EGRPDPGKPPADLLRQAANPGGEAVPHPGQPPADVVRQPPDPGREGVPVLDDGRLAGLELGDHLVDLGADLVEDRAEVAGRDLACRSAEVVRCVVDDAGVGGVLIPRRERTRDTGAGEDGPATESGLAEPAELAAAQRVEEAAHLLLVAVGGPADLVEVADDARRPPRDRGDRGEQLEYRVDALDGA